MTPCKPPMTDPRDEIVGHVPTLRAYALSLTRNRAAADDLVQDTIIRAWTNIDKFRAGTNMRAWLVTILRNIFFSDLRKRHREVADPDGLYASRLCVTPDHDARLAWGEFLLAYNKLSPCHREALKMVGALGFSYEEAAEVARVAAGTMKSRVSRARRILGNHLRLAGGACNMPDVDGVIKAGMSQPVERVLAVA